VHSRPYRWGRRLSHEQATAPSSARRDESEGPDFDRFRSARYFPQLDGLRALSVTLVLTIHSGDALWEPLNGYLGVTIFFVISGFLITTLLVREEELAGAVSLWRFYVRRVFRIFPLYLLALAVFCMLVMVFGLGHDPDAFVERLPLLATYNGEFAGSGTFSHSWSLGIEEKFYLVWPLLAFGCLAIRRHRVAVALGVLALTVVAAGVEPVDYLGIYVPIAAGCVVAVLLNDRRWYLRLSLLRHPIVAVLLTAGAIAELLMNSGDRHIQVLFACLVALLMPTVVTGTPAVVRVLTARPVRFVGTRAYGIYLFHPLVGEVLSRALPTNGPVALQVVRLLLILAVSLVVADILYRLVEKPLIAVGRRLTRRRSATGQPAGSRSTPVQVRSSAAT
jgi:peptidoglycan/LPS O-acetylase OafA/YrhL